MGLAERIAQRLHCPGCGRRYVQRDLQLVGAGADELDLYMHCGACGLYLRLTVPEQDLTAGVVHAVVPESVPRRQEQEPQSGSPVTADDVVEMRAFLSSFDGDVKKLLRAGD